MRRPGSGRGHVLCLAPLIDSGTGKKILRLCAQYRKSPVPLLRAVNDVCAVHFSLLRTRRTAAMGVITLFRYRWVILLLPHEYTVLL